MNYSCINNREILLKEYDSQNRMIERKNNIFDKLGFVILGGIALYLKEYGSEKISDIISSDNIFLIILSLCIIGVVSVVADLISQKIIESRKKEIILKIEALE